MEKGVNNKEIDRYNQLNKNQLFFIQRWLEILNVNTHSSYAIKYLNSHQALNELVYVIDGMLNGDINANNHHLRVVIEEAREVVTNDWLLREQLEHYYLILTTRLKGIPKANEKTQLHSLVYQINYILRELKKTYLTSIVDKINQLLGSQQDGTKKELKELDFLIKSLVSELIALGWSNKRLYESVKDGLLTSKLRDSSWDAFFVELLKSERKFICLFKFNSKPSKDMLRKMEILSMDCVTGPHVTNTQMDELLKPHIKKHHVYLRVITKAYDYYSAHDSAWSKIERNMDMLQFYGFKLPDVNKSAFVIDDSQRQFYRNIIGSSFLQGKKYRATERTLEYTKNQLSDDTYEKVNKKIETLLDFSRKSEESLSPKKSFVNLWIALESFVIGKEDVGGFESVKKNISAADTHNYLYSLNRNLMEDMGRCGVNWRLEGSHSYYIKEEQNFLLCLLNDKTGPKLVEKCKQVNVLLGYRCENLREHFLSNRKTSQLLRNHKVNIERHLRRMYRIRNDIVHSGETYYNTNLFIKHLREYVEGIASVVLFRIRMHDVYSLDEALSIIRDSVDVTTEILSDLGKDHNLSDEEYIGMLLNGVF